MMCKDMSSVKVVEDMMPLDESSLIRIDQTVQVWLKSQCEYLRDDFGQAVMRLIGRRSFAVVTSRFLGIGQTQQQLIPLRS